ncbi:MAG TPA: hypothetical protein VER36_09205 [Flavisolibacter sp.]|nr:hypothetical protein [Flavisolibacter sp.]
MKHLLCTLLLLPMFTLAQRNTYFSADGSISLAKGFDNTAYGINLSGNYGLSESLFLGIAGGAFKMAPFLNNVSVPLSARFTFFPFTDKDRLVPFGMLEGGKLFYSEGSKLQNGTGAMKGKSTVFAGLGTRFPSLKASHGFIAIGYAGFWYGNSIYNREGALVAQQNFSIKRVTVKLGLMLPHTSRVQ